MKRAHIALIAIIAGFIGISFAISRQPGEPSATPASSPADDSDNLRCVLDMFRSDLNASKIRTLNQTMRLSDAEAEKFWPIYQKYETELGVVDDRRVLLIKEFVSLTDSGKFTESNAADLSERWLKVTQDRLDLWRRYHREIGSAVSAIRAAHFLQLEHQIALLVDINIASEMPVVAAPIDGVR